MDIEEYYYIFMDMFFSAAELNLNDVDLKINPKTI